LRRTYGVTERVFRHYFSKATKQEGIAGENFLRILERRLDNVVYRLGFAPSRPAARQLVAHGNVKVNGSKVDITSFLVKKDMEISVNDQLANNNLVVESLEHARVRHVPAWLQLDENAAKGKVLALPNRSEIATEVNEQVIVEFYSRMGC
jgi:small subunit ribosomal protein S4